MWKQSRMLFNNTHNPWKTPQPLTAYEPGPGPGLNKLFQLPILDPRAGALQAKAGFRVECCQR